MGGDFSSFRKPRIPLPQKQAFAGMGQMVAFRGRTQLDTCGKSLIGGIDPAYLFFRACFIISINEGN
ncbi:MAG: hypothetical protein HN646_09505 [Nitrospina sp.]|nr:hypothetical protein [Nitrospina sp.]